MTTSVPGVVGSNPSGLNAGELLKQLLRPDQAFRKIVPVAIDGAPPGLCVRTLTTGEALRRDQLREALFAHLDSVEGRIDEQLAKAGAAAEDRARAQDLEKAKAVAENRAWEGVDEPGATPAQRAMLIRANRRSALGTALAVAFVACDQNGAEIFTKDAAIANVWDKPSLPRNLKFQADAGGDGQAASGVGNKDGDIFVEPHADVREAWYRCMLVEQALPFAVAAELVAGSNKLSKAQRDELGKVSWSGQPSSN